MNSTIRRRNFALMCVERTTRRVRHGAPSFTDDHGTRGDVPRLDPELPVPVDSSRADPGTVEPILTPDGERIVDAKGRTNQTKLTFWVTGGDEPPAREVKQEVVQIIPDKKEYAPGNTAELLVQAPVDPSGLGETVKPTEPAHRQIFIGRGATTPDQM